MKNTKIRSYLLFHGNTEKKNFLIDSVLSPESRLKLHIEDRTTYKDIKPCSSLFQAMKRTGNTISGKIQILCVDDNNEESRETIGYWSLLKNGILTLHINEYLITFPKKITQKTLSHITRMLLPHGIEFPEHHYMQEDFRNNQKSTLSQPFFFKKILSNPKYYLGYCLKDYIHEGGGQPISFPENKEFYLVYNRGKYNELRTLILDLETMTKSLIHKYRNPPRIYLDLDIISVPSEHETLTKTLEFKKDIEKLMPEINEWMNHLKQEREIWKDKPKIKDILLENARKIHGCTVLKKEK